MAIDRETKKWVRNVSDERAAANGCRFDEARGQFVCEWIETYCKLYEGEWAGQKLKLLDWARDVTLRLFGWVRHAKQWGREVRRFRQASIWVAKKNAKSPTLAAWGLYLLCGDGEQGQKVFFGAKDGKQARDIAGKHVVEMLRQSDELQDESKLNLSTLQLTHLPTRSVMVPLSSSNARTQESKEGLNGSVLVDEVHVVDRDFIRRISRAGISRSEPLQIEVSTAGNNPDGYGRERFDYARQVEDGTFTDQDLFVAIYAAPQDLTDEQLAEHPLKYGKMANPAMGVTVDPEEYLKDYETSKRSIQAMLDFKMYRLNIWQKGANPWLKGGDWAKCKKDFTEDDLEGRDCWAALDLARTRDMSSLLLAFPEEEEEEAFKILPYFWIPRDRVLELEDRVSMGAWERDGHLTITPGGVTDFAYIKAKFRELSQKFNIRLLVYDFRFAEEVTQSISDGTTDGNGVTIEEGTGVERLPFLQDDASFAKPTEDFERLVIAGKMHHNGHPVLSWQAGHVCVMRKISKVKRAVKPKKDGWQTIDGIIAAIMATGAAAAAPSEHCRVEVWG